jgi:hypothetical protein
VLDDLSCIVQYISERNISTSKVEIEIHFLFESKKYVLLLPRS